MIIENIKVEYKPFRVGFCVRDGKVKDVLDAARLSSLLWGGIYNPIIPVGDREGLDKKLIDLFQVDVLVPISDSPEIKKFINRYKWLNWPLHYPGSLIYQDNQKKKKEIALVDVSDIIKILWKKEFRLSKENISNCRLPIWKTSDKANNLFTLLFGSYPDKKEFGFDFNEEFKVKLQAEKILIKDKLPSILAESISPISLTKYDLKSFGGRHVEGGLFIGNENNFKDLINFWNIRACGNYISFFPLEEIERFLSYAKKHISYIKKPSRFDGLPFIFVWYRDERNIKKIKDIIGKLKDERKKFLFSKTSIHFWNGMNIIPTHNTFGEMKAISSIGERYQAPFISIQVLEKPIDFKELQKYYKKHLIASIRPSAGLEFSEHTIDLPVFPDLHEWYTRKMIIEPRSLRVSRTPFGRTVNLITDIASDTMRLTPIPKFDLIEKIFERAKIKITKSNAGLVAERLIAIMGGIDGNRIFKITGVRKFIDETQPILEKSKNEIINKIIDNNSFNNFKNEFGLSGKFPITPEEVFNIMTEKNLIRAGLKVYCPKCSLKSWIPLKEIDEDYICEFCSKKSKFVNAIKSKKVKGKEIDGTTWSYRLSGLLGKGDNQQGAIPVVITLLQLFHVTHSFGNDIYSTGLDLEFKKDGKDRKIEIDLAFFDLSERYSKNDIEILIGECKTKNEITKKSINNLLNAKQFLEKSGVKCHLIFSKTKDKFSQNEINHFKKLVTKGIDPILFTSNELEPWYINLYKYYDTKIKNFNLPVKHPFTFSDLAKNSVYIYKLK